MRFILLFLISLSLFASSEENALSNNKKIKVVDYEAYQWFDAENHIPFRYECIALVEYEYQKARFEKNTPYIARKTFSINGDFSQPKEKLVEEFKNMLNSENLIPNIEAVKSVRCVKYEYND